MIQFKMVTPRGVFREYPVKSIHATSAEGEFTLLPNHIPVVMALRPCKLTVVNGQDEKKEYAISGGFLHFDNNRAVLLSDAIEGKSDIDLQRAHAAYERARERLEKKDDLSQLKREELSLQKALNRISVGEGK